MEYHTLVRDKDILAVAVVGVGHAVPHCISLCQETSGGISQRVTHVAPGSLIRVPKTRKRTVRKGQKVTAYTQREQGSKNVKRARDCRHSMIREHQRFQGIRRPHEVIHSIQRRSDTVQIWFQCSDIWPVRVTGMIDSTIIEKEHIYIVNISPSCRKGISRILLMFDELEGQPQVMLCADVNYCCDRQREWRHAPVIDRMTPEMMAKLDRNPQSMCARPVGLPGDTKGD